MSCPSHVFWSENELNELIQLQRQRRLIYIVSLCLALGGKVFTVCCRPATKDCGENPHLRHLGGDQS